MKRWERIAYAIDTYRAVPRTVLTGCAYMTWHVTHWFMDLKEPTVAQGTFVSVVYGVIPLILNFYMAQGVDWEKRLAGRKNEPNDSPMGG
jgi:hypothetical protein